MTAARRQQLDLFGSTAPVQGVQVQPQPAGVIKNCRSSTDPQVVQEAPAVPGLETLPLSPDHPVVLTLQYERLDLAARQSAAALRAQLGGLGGAFALLLQLGTPQAEVDQQQYAKLTAELARVLCVPVDQVDAVLERADAERRTKEAAEKAARRSPRPNQSTTLVSPSQPASSGPGRSPGRRPRSNKAPPALSEAAPPTKRITDRQRQLLQGFEAGPDNVIRYRSQDHVPDWIEAKSVLVALGGKWRPGKPVGGFHFGDGQDAAELLRLALATGEVLDSRAAGFFPTGPELAGQLAALAELTPGCQVLEPSAGQGAVALAVRQACPTARIHVVELLPDNRVVLERLGLELIGSDFMALAPEPRFDVAVGNPPFAARADVHHLRRWWEWLRPGGRLVGIASAGVLYRDDALGREFRAWVQAHGRMEALPDGSFAHAGTQVRTALVVMRKGGASV